jgi:ABC-2 type transport system permease protein
MGFMGFLKKEFNEIVKTQKLIILPVVFLFFGLSSPLIAKNMPELMKSLAGDMNIPIPKPVFWDAYAQFYKNLTQIGVIVMILTFMGMVVDEKVRGTAILVLTKGVTRAQFILSKLLASFVLFFASFSLGALACIYYTYLLFPSFDNGTLWLSLVSFLLYGLFIVSITLFASTISKSHVASAVIAFVGYAAFSAASYIPKVGKFLPGTLSDLSTQLLQGAKTSSDVIAPMIVTISLVALLIIITIADFNRQEL